MQVSEIVHGSCVVLYHELLAVCTINRGEKHRTQILSDRLNYLFLALCTKLIQRDARNNEVEESAEGSVGSS